MKTRLQSGELIALPLVSQGPPVQGGTLPPDRLVLGDCLEVMRRLPPASIDLIYVDPPFATGRRFDGLSKRGERVAFSDVWTGGLGEYLAWLRPRLAGMWGLLRPSGNLVVHLDWRAVHGAKLLLDELFGARNFRNELIWHYGSGGRARRFFHRKHDVLLWYSRTGRWQFHGDRVSVPRDRCPQCGTRREQWNHLKRHEDADGRVYRTIRSAGKVYRYYDDEPAVPPDVWTDISHLQQKDPERQGYPTQKPEALLHRVISALSAPGDRVADFFCGSGTTCAVAQELGRRWIGCDISAAAVELARRRLDRRGDDLPGTAPGFSREHCGVLGLPPRAWKSAASFRSALREWLGARPPPEGARWIHGVLPHRHGELPLWIAGPRSRAPVTPRQLAQLARQAAQRLGSSEALVLTWAPGAEAQRAALELAIREGVCVATASLVRGELDADPAPGRDPKGSLLWCLPPPTVSGMEVARLGPLTYRFALRGLQPRGPTGAAVALRWAAVAADGSELLAQWSQEGRQVRHPRWEQYLAAGAAGQRVRILAQVVDAWGSTRIFTESFVLK